jgi:hypothetical protein
VPPMMTSFMIRFPFNVSISSMDNGPIGMTARLSSS